MYYNDNEQLVTLCDVSTLSCSTTIDGLQPYTLYSIEVSSRTAAGEGPRTNPIIVTRLPLQVSLLIMNLDDITCTYYTAHPTSTAYKPLVRICIAVVFGIVPYTITSFLPALTLQLQ